LSNGVERPYVTAEESPDVASRAAVILLFVSSGVFTLGDGAVLLLLAPHLAEQGVSSPVIGPIVATYSGAALLFRFVTGAVYRSYRLRYLVPGGCLVQAASFVVLANSSSTAWLAITVALNGAGFAIASTGGLAAVMELRPAGNAGSLMGWYTGCIGAGYGAAGFVGGAAGDLFGISGALTAVTVFPLLAAAGLAGALWPVGRSAADSTTDGDAAQGPGPRRRRSPVAALLSVGPYVWLAFFCALHINLLSGVLLTFFPLYGLAIGLSLTQIGSLTGASSALSSAIRFTSPALFKRIDYRSVLPWMVLLGGAATAALTVSRVYVILLLAWLGIGASRALLRVSSAALVMNASGGGDRQRGLASGTYMSGLDIGKIIGPVLGGLSVNSLGYEPTFLLAGLGIPAVFFAYYAWLKLRADGVVEPEPG
jgi:predicted MFS family arabinose efflux permease